jgi:hypothetical protein
MIIIYLIKLKLFKLLDWNVPFWSDTEEIIQIPNGQFHFVFRRPIRVGLKTLFGSVFHFISEVDFVIRIIDSMAKFGTSIDVWSEIEFSLKLDLSFSLDPYLFSCLIPVPINGLESKSGSESEDEISSLFLVFDLGVISDSGSVLDLSWTFDPHFRFDSSLIFDSFFCSQFHHYFKSIC